MSIEDLNDIFNRPIYYRRDGTPYKDMMEWAADMEKANVEGTKHVARTRLWWGGYVSTIWLGLDHSFCGGKPLIFETMVFPPEGLGSMDMSRYHTEEEAKTGHEAMCRRWRNPFYLAFYGALWVWVRKCGKAQKWLSRLHRRPRA